MNSAVRNGAKLDQLTSLRFFAAIMIVFHHLPGVLGVKSAPINLGSGVSFFFVLSGFILTYVYPQFNGIREVGAFLRARWARLWPAYLASFVIGALLTTYIWDAGILFAHLAMLQAWIPVSAYYFSFNGVAWSISTELFFYLLFPVLVLVRPKSWWLLLLAAAAFLVHWLYLVERLGLPEYGSPLTPEGMKITENGLVYIGPLSRAFEFILGVVFAKLWLARKFGWSRATATVFEIAAVVICVASVYYIGLASYAWAKAIGSTGATWVLHSGSCFAFGILVFVFAVGRGWVSAILKNPVLVVLGEISFSVYLLHNIFIAYYVKHAADFFWIGDVAGLVLFFGVLIVCSYLVWAWIEKPGRALLLGRASINRRGISSPSGWIFPGGAAAVVCAVFMSAFIGLTYVNGSAGDVSGTGMTPEKYRKFVGAKFGGSFELTGLSFSCRGQDMMVKFVWKKTSAVPNGHGVPVHIVNAAGEILGQADYTQDAKVRSMADGSLFVDRLVIRSAQVPALSSALAVGMYGAPGQLMKIDHSLTDWNGHRLVIEFDQCRG